MMFGKRGHEKSRLSAIAGAIQTYGFYKHRRNNFN
jgi:hypothetical protein